MQKLKRNVPESGSYTQSLADALQFTRKVRKSVKLRQSAAVIPTLEEEPKGMED